jgi:hypothetical protein
MVATAESALQRLGMPKAAIQTEGVGDGMASN